MNPIMKTKKKALEITTKEEYIKEFGRDIRLRKRKAIYVHPDIHDRMVWIARSLKSHNISLSSLVTIILIRHTNMYWPIIDKMINEEEDAPPTPKDGKASGGKPANKTENGSA